MKYVIDRIEDNIVICQNLESKEMVEIEKSLLPQNIKDGTILLFENNEYKLDLKEEELRRQRIRERFNRLKQR